MAGEFLDYGRRVIRAADAALATAASGAGPQAATRDVLGRRKCITPEEMAMSGGMVAHTGSLGPEGLVEATTGVTVRRLADGETNVMNMALSFQSTSVSDAKWLQFLGPSVIAATGQGDERLIGDLVIGGVEVCGTRSRKVTVTTTISPGDTPYFLDSPISSSFANLPCTTFCQTFASGQEKTTFFDRPFFNFAGVQKALKRFSEDYNNVNGVFPESLRLIADFYSYLVVKKTAAYLIHWQAEHEVPVTEAGGIRASEANYRQTVLPADCGPVTGLAAEHHMILLQAFPHANIR